MIFARPACAFSHQTGRRRNPSETQTIVWSEWVWNGIFRKTLVRHEANNVFRVRVRFILFYFRSHTNRKSVRGQTRKSTHVGVNENWKSSHPFVVSFNFRLIVMSSSSLRRCYCFNSHHCRIALFWHPLLECPFQLQFQFFSGKSANRRAKMDNSRVRWEHLLTAKHVRQ